MIMNFVSERVEDIVGTGENARNQHFLLFPQCFQKTFCSGSSGLYGKELMRLRDKWHQTNHHYYSGLLTIYSIDTHFDASTTHSF